VNQDRVTCVYCGQSAQQSSLEHVIPDALGGGVTTRAVCRGCNSHMGSDVDAEFVNSKYMQFVRFAFQDFLPADNVPTILLNGELHSPNGEQRFPGRFRLSLGSLEFEPRYHTEVSGNVTTYYMPDTEDGKRNFERLRNSGKAGIHTAGWFELPSAPNCLTIAEEMVLPYAKEVLKIFLGFLAAEGLNEIALGSVFDGPRRYLRSGNAADLGEGFAMSTGVRTDSLELLPNVGHELGFKRERGRDVFYILLFDCVLFEMIIDDKLAVVPAIQRRYELPRQRSTFFMTLFRMMDPRQIHME
jgi:hypothetical protein